MPRKLDNWITSYVSYADKHEAPEIFHRWCALNCISVALSRRVVIPKPFYELYPNLFVCLVAPTGRCRKGGAIRLMNRFLFKLGIPTANEKATPEALLEFLHNIGKEQPDGVSRLFFWADELDNFLSQDAYKRGMYSQLTHLYDCPDQTSSLLKTKTSSLPKNVYLNIFAATTPSWLFRSIPREASTIGLAGRIVFICQMAGRRFANPQLDDEHRALRAKLHEDLEHIYKLSGEMRFTKEAQEWYDEWYARPEHTVSAAEATLGYYERKHDMLQKVGCLWSIARGDSLVIGRADLIEAEKILRDMERHMHIAYNAISSTEHSRTMDCILSVIQERSPRPVPLSVIINAVKDKIRSLKHLYEMLAILVSGEYIETDTKGKKYWLKGTEVEDSPFPEISYSDGG